MTQKMMTLDFTELELRMLALLSSKEQSRMDTLINDYPECDALYRLKLTRAKTTWREIEKKVAEKLQGD